MPFERCDSGVGLGAKHALSEDGRELAASAVVFRSVSDSSDGSLSPFHQPDFLPLDVLFSLKLVTSLGCECPLAAVDSYNAIFFNSERVFAKILRAKAVSEIELCALPNRRLHIPISGIYSHGGKKKDPRTPIDILFSSCGEEAVTNV
ncbi:hypothetical protein EVAR_55062_1 [Eumeta japonica]|uniref:Uncharacterized protein n=1 Tax=Eumeta variegata TaxID=151549 RepID=A0A4C1Z3Q0_EUMVA|nr:hypothetical protein EVAR_55062_1 [Eumeta japonica]